MASKISSIVSEIIELLRNRNHNCIVYNEHANILEWCHQDICIKDDLKTIQKNNDNFAIFLQNNGHKCISYAESYPVQIIWCGNKICSHE